MAITKPKPKVEHSSAEDFISAAPDAEAKAKAKPRGVRKGNKQQISLTITPVLLGKVDEMAAEMGLSRAAVINMAIYQAMENGLTIDGARKS